MTYEQDDHQDQCYHISCYVPPRGGMSMMGHGKEIGRVEPKDFMKTIKRTLIESKDTKYIISCPVDADGFGDTVVWSRGDRVHLVEEYYSDYQWSVDIDSLTLKSFDSPRYSED